MIEYAREALTQIAALKSHYQRLQRINAVRALDAALRLAEDQISRRGPAGLTAPRPYPKLARPGVAWIKAGRYWIAYSQSDASAVILSVFYDTADIPGRL